MSILPYICVCVLSGAVGLAEILSRYRDVPSMVLRGWPAWTYIATNAAAGVMALWIIEASGWTFGEDLEPAAQHGLQVAAAGFGALAVMRAAVIQIRVDDRVVSVGPSLILNVLLNFTANNMSRKRAAYLDKIVNRIMAKVDFNKAKEQLPSYCFSLMRTPEDEQKAVSREVTSLDVSTLANNTKSLLLGLLLLELVGEDVLNKAVDTLQGEIGLNEA